MTMYRRTKRRSWRDDRNAKGDVVCDHGGVVKTNHTPGVGIVGCGLVGQKRAKTLGVARLVACASRRMENAQSLARTVPDAIAFADWRRLVELDTVDIVVVATSNDMLAEVAEAAAQHGKHVLVEKPAARHVRELDSVMESAQRSGVRVRVGFNHRYHPALRQARALFDAGILGEIMFVRGRYGHGGRVGYDQEWRANPALSGGGVLTDLGVHLIDLARWFLGNFSEVSGFTPTCFWNMSVEDNAFLLLKTPRRQAAFLHVSCTEWKNLFCLEIYGREGKLQVDGLGGSYGVERVTYYKMLPQMGPPETTIWEYPSTDLSWQIEFAEFLEDVRLGRTPSASLEDARAALMVVHEIYVQTGRA
jgi:predicted dehydrogenase